MAKCRKPKDGPLKYMSVTTFEDCYVDLLVSFYMDNDYRMQWDKTNRIRDKECLSLELSWKCLIILTCIAFQKIGIPLSQGSSQSHFLQQWQTSTHDGIANFQRGQDLMAMEKKEQHSSQVDMQKYGSDSQNQEEDRNSTHQPNPLLHNPSINTHQHTPDDQNTIPLSQPMLTQTSESNSRTSCLTSPIETGINSKAPPKNPLAGQEKPMETPGSSSPSSSKGKKQNVAGAFLDQSIEHLNDIAAISGVNLREEEEQLFSGPKEDSRVSEASRRVVQEEDRLFLQKIPLQKKVMEIMVKCGLKNMSNEVEKCLSLCMEERMRGLISNTTRLSKQRVDTEKPRHKTIITSDVRQQIMTINCKAQEEWEKKQPEIEKLKKLNDVNKEEDDKMCTTAANVAIRAATGLSDMSSRWKSMADKQKQEGSESGPQTSKDLGQKGKSTSTRNTRENQDSEKRKPSASVIKVGTNQEEVPRVARSISVKDVIAALEREPRMSKSMLLYRLYNKTSPDATGE